jgi:glycine/D-amino acid oxidase-like deaminating enzyme
VSGDRLREGGDCEAPEQILPDPKRVSAASASFRGMSSLGDREPDATNSCMRPCAPDALPVMGAVPNVDGAYVSCGHNCWGESVPLHTLNFKRAMTV